MNAPTSPIQPVAWLVTWPDGAKSYYPSEPAHVPGLTYEPLFQAMDDAGRVEVEEARYILQCLFPLHLTVLEQNENRGDAFLLDWTIDLGTLRQVSKFLLSVPRPELGLEITDEMIERGARAHCPFAFEAGSGGAGRAEAIENVRAILTAALSVPRPERRMVVGRVTGKLHEGDQVPGMPGAICHACGLKDYPCVNPDCPHLALTSQNPQKAQP